MVILIIWLCVYVKVFINDYDINIDVVKSSPHQVLTKEEFGFIDKRAKNISIVIYDIEEVYFKNEINVTNKYMLNDSDIIVCYVDMGKRHSGAKKAVNYAERQGKEIINVFEKYVDEEFNKLTLKEKMKKIKEYLKQKI